MILQSGVWWMPVLLSAVLLVDALLSMRPLRFIQDCLDGVGYPRDWWWALTLIKLLGAVGLLVGLWVPGAGIAANVGVVGYFLAAAASHLRARFLGPAFWVNFLGMLLLSIAVLVLSLAW